MVLYRIKLMQECKMKMNEIKELMRLFGKSKLDKIKIKHKDFEIEMQKNIDLSTAEIAEEATTPESIKITQAKQKISGEAVISPMIGKLYTAPSPDSAPFIAIGDQVKKGDLLCILEAMNIMNELKAEYDCKILDILVESGETVEYGKTLFIVERV